jgi:hypothetical protein
MSKWLIAQKIELAVRAYFEACEKRDVNAIAACFASEAVHYLPHLHPLRGGVTIGNAIVGDLNRRGGAYHVDRIYFDVEQWAAAVEWSRTFQQGDRILRGQECCEFDSASVLIREIRGYYAAAPHGEVARHELVGFDYAGRAYTTLS